MNLIIDAGNTTIKIAIFKDGKLIHKDKCLQTDVVLNLEQLLQNYPNVSMAIISSVSSFGDELLGDVLTEVDVFILNHTAKFPFKNLYATPHTLGKDRLALVSAAYNFYPNKNTLIIDAGTCITYDFLNQKNEYLGGAISPGIGLRYKSLNTYTANLPLLFKERPDDITGNSTDQSIHSGVINGVVLEIEGAIDRYKMNYPDLTVILTGGDCKFLSNQIKYGIFANSNFLLEGLNFILEYNTIK